MTLDLTQWTEQYAQWQNDLAGRGLLTLLCVVLIVILADFIKFRVFSPQASCNRDLRSYFRFTVAAVTIAVFTAVFIVSEGFWLGKPPTITPVIEKGYGITSLSCGDDDITKDGWHSCTAVKDRRLVELKLDKENTHVTVYDRHTGERLETAE